ncbi:hypothetical protein ILYODFUR_032210 [Ilyodon furcidens]|uniref:Uncharacterized protein n=1 Tax=Ilyodon furcidens TaxID=33524 RepID=A0ABV0V9T8_9TELE
MKKQNQANTKNCQIWSLNENSTWKTHLYCLRFNQSTSSPHPSPANHPSSFASKDLHSWNHPIFSRALTLLHPISSIRLPNSSRLPYLLRPPLHHQSDPRGKKSLILILSCSSKLTSFSAYRSSSGVRAPKK